MSESQEVASKEKYGMAIDLDKCTGCGACTVSCLSENNHYVREDESDKLRSVAWMKVYKVTNGEPFPNTKVAFIPRPCMHCDHHTPCVSVCPVLATDYNPLTGIVSQIYTRCIGCRYCVGACPYHARYFNWWDPVWPEGMHKLLNPDMSPRMRGVVEKCSFCNHRLQKAKDKAYVEGRRDLKDGEYVTACADACPTKAITFGNMKDPESAVAKLIKSPGAFRLLEKLGTQPKVYYLSNESWIRESGDNALGRKKTARPA
ncbi:MAG: menaquinone reductase iron-sulfur cluster-binding subunit QrcC [Deltaproteobacteria bacterium]|nr:menaquinone reductase iron-sulfur cluster-binding subunit QrcC [Deltaproteobacteria bacterium]